MSQEVQPHEITKRAVLFTIPGADAVTVRTEVAYSSDDASDRVLDLYYPQHASSAKSLPAVLFATGYPDAGFQRMLGCRLKDMASYVSWGQLMAASGMVAVTYANVEPVADLRVVYDYLRDHADELGIDRNRIGLWACSGNVPNALSLLMQPEQYPLQCAALLYGMMLDFDGVEHVATAAKMFGFVNPAAGKSANDLPVDLPLFIARAGQDAPELNEVLDRFVIDAIRRNLPLSFVNHPIGPHAFDLMDDSETTREIIGGILAFMQVHLLK